MKCKVCEKEIKQNIFRHCCLEASWYKQPEEHLSLAQQIYRQEIKLMQPKQEKAEHEAVKSEQEVQSGTGRERATQTGDSGGSGQGNKGRTSGESFQRGASGTSKPDTEFDIGARLREILRE